MNLPTGRSIFFRPVVESRIDPSGTMINCTVVESDRSPNDRCAGRVCVKTMPPLIKDGKPVSRAVTYTGTIDPD